MLSPDDNIEGVDEEAQFVETEETGYEDIECGSNDYFNHDDW